MQNKRNSNIELLRMTAIFMVVVVHAIGWTGARYLVWKGCFWSYNLLEALCVCAVDIFVLISGYFLINSKFKARNVFRTAIGGVWIYSVVFTALNMALRSEAVSRSEYISMFLPFVTKKYWFVNSYVALYILSPFINKALHSLNRRQLTCITLTMVCMFSLRSTFLPVRWSQDESAGLNIISFVTLYCIGAWMRLCYKPNGKSGKFLLVYLASALLITVTKRVVLDLGLSESLSEKFYMYSSIFVYAEAVSLFLAVLNMKQIGGRTGELINAAAKHSLGVYIIHCSLYGVLFKSIFSLYPYLGYPVRGALAVIAYSAAVFVLCALTDAIKTRLFGLAGRALADTKLNRLYGNITERWENAVN